MELRELINRLETLSRNGENDRLEVCVKNSEDMAFPFVVKGVMIMQDPYYYFDEANCAPNEWIEISTYENLKYYGKEQ